METVHVGRGETSGLRRVTAVCTLREGDLSGGDKAKKGVKRKKILEENGETAKRRSARVRNTKCKKEEKVDFQELLLKFLPPRYSHAVSDLQTHQLPPAPPPSPLFLHCPSGAPRFPTTSAPLTRAQLPWIGASGVSCSALGLPEGSERDLCSFGRPGASRPQRCMGSGAAGHALRSLGTHAALGRPGGQVGAAASAWPARLFRVSMLALPAPQKPSWLCHGNE